MEQTSERHLRLATKLDDFMKDNTEKSPCKKIKLYPDISDYRKNNIECIKVKMK